MQRAFIQEHVLEPAWPNTLQHAHCNWSYRIPGFKSRCATSRSWHTDTPSTTFDAKNLRQRSPLPRADGLPVVMPRSLPAGWINRPQACSNFVSLGTCSESLWQGWRCEKARRDSPSTSCAAHASPHKSCYSVVMQPTITNCLLQYKEWYERACCPFMLLSRVLFLLNYSARFFFLKESAAFCCCQPSSLQSLQGR